MAKNEKTSKKVAAEASKELRNPKTTKIAKSVAGSALAQTADKKKKKWRLTANSRPASLKYSNIFRLAGVLKGEAVNANLLRPALSLCH